MAPIFINSILWKFFVSIVLRAPVRLCDIILCFLFRSVAVTELRAGQGRDVQQVRATEGQTVVRRTTEPLHRAAVPVASGTHQAVQDSPLERRGSADIRDPRWIPGCPGVCRGERGSRVNGQRRRDGRRSRLDWRCNWTVTTLERRRGSAKDMQETDLML